MNTKTVPFPADVQATEPTTADFKGLLADIQAARQSDDQMAAYIAACDAALLASGLIKTVSEAVGLTPQALMSAAAHLLAARDDLPECNPDCEAAMISMALRESSLRDALNRSGFDWYGVGDCPDQETVLRALLKAGAKNIFPGKAWEITMSLHYPLDEDAAAALASLNPDTNPDAYLGEEIITLVWDN